MKEQEIPLKLNQKEALELLKLLTIGNAVCMGAGHNMTKAKGQVMTWAMAHAVYAGLDKTKWLDCDGAMGGYQFSEKLMDEIDGIMQKFMEKAMSMLLEEMGGEDEE